MEAAQAAHGEQHQGADEENNGNCWLDIESGADAAPPILDVDEVRDGEPQQLQEERGVSVRERRGRTARRRRGSDGLPAPTRRSSAKVEKTNVTK